MKAFGFRSAAVAGTTSTRRVAAASRTLTVSPERDFIVSDPPSLATAEITPRMTVTGVCAQAAAQANMASVQTKNLRMASLWGNGDDTPRPKTRGARGLFPHIRAITWRGSRLVQPSVPQRGQEERRMLAHM